MPWQVFSVPGRCYPVEIVHATEDHVSAYVDAAIDTAMQLHVSQPPGDMRATSCRGMSWQWHAACVPRLFAQHLPAGNASARLLQLRTCCRTCCDCVSTCSLLLQQHFQKLPFWSVPHSTPGDVLVFLTGQAEIEKAVARLNSEVRTASKDEVES
jgi:HrpA-like RNA helicase